MSSHEIAIRSDAEVIADSIEGVTNAIRDSAAESIEQLTALTKAVIVLAGELRELKQFIITHQRT
jgi:predicted ATP-dependent serine protease